MRPAGRTKKRGGPSLALTVRSTALAVLLQPVSRIHRLERPDPGLVAAIAGLEHLAGEQIALAEGAEGCTAHVDHVSLAAQRVMAGRADRRLGRDHRDLRHVNGRALEIQSRYAACRANTSTRRNQAVDAGVDISAI